MRYVKVTVNHQPSSKKIVILSLHAPHNLNAINQELYEELKQALEEVSKDKTVGALILNSEVSNAFSAGVDLQFIQGLSNEEASNFFTKLSELFDMLIHLSVPTISFVNGYAFGAGADLAISCDVRIASEAAYFRFPGPQFGLVLGTQRLVNEIGSSKARFLALSGKKISGQIALEYGLVHELYADEEAGQKGCLKWAKILANVPSYTTQTIKEVCHSGESFHELTRASVLEGDFIDRFGRYVQNNKKKVRH
ncbi:enoyl-CoA hydratase/isomerase family protein [Priestia megaterium]|uniref:enoyl-CoA hydratase/isomerase family protein n=1 Tax=Priestia megaterium TaxID=1404 RepID=UPI003CFEF81F